MYIYLDVLFIVNFYIAWLTLSLTSKICHIKQNFLQRSISSLIGGLSSFLCLIEIKNDALNFLLILAKLMSLILICAVAFYKLGKRKWITATIVYLIINLLLGGAIYLLQSDSAFIYNGSLYFDIPFKRLIYLTALVYIALSIVQRLYEARCKRSQSYSVKIKYKDRIYDLPAVADTGNKLKEIISGKPIIFCKGISLDEEDAGIPIPFSTVSGEGIAYAHKADLIEISDSEHLKANVDAYVSFLPSVEGEAYAIFDPEIL